MVKALKRNKKTCIYKIVIEWEAKKELSLQDIKKLAKQIPGHTIKCNKYGFFADCIEDCINCLYLHDIYNLRIINNRLYYDGKGVVFIGLPF